MDPARLLLLLLLLQASMPCLAGELWLIAWHAWKPRSDKCRQCGARRLCAGTHAVRMPGYEWLAVPVDCMQHQACTAMMQSTSPAAYSCRHTVLVQCDMTTTSLVLQPAR